VSDLYEVGSRLSGRYRAQGMACFYGGHYVAFIRKKGSWVMCDDAHVTPVIGDWAAVQERCITGAMQPSLLLFEKAS
jgi:ubiquitin C-terminal hydrolase